MASSIEGQGSDVPEVLVREFRNKNWNSENIIEGQHLDDVGNWDIKHDPNFFVYDMEGNLVFKAYSYAPRVEPVTVTKEYRGGYKNETSFGISHTKGMKITL